MQYGPWVQAGTAVDRAGAVEALSTLGHLGVSGDDHSSDNIDARLVMVGCVPILGLCSFVRSC